MSCPAETCECRHPSWMAAVRRRKKGKPRHIDVFLDEIHKNAKDNPSREK